MAIKLQIRRGLAADWAAGTANPQLLAGEIGVETDTGNIKIGDGTTLWNSLGYVKSTYPQTTGHATNINDSTYLVQGRYEIGTGVTSNVPSGWTPASDAPAILHVTRTSTGYVAQILVSTKTQKAFSRGYDGSAYTTWVKVSQEAGSIGTTELADSAVTTIKIADSSSTTTGVTNVKLRQAVALSVIGNGTNATAAPADIAAGTTGHVLRRSGTAVAFGTLESGAFASTTDVPLTSLADIANDRLLGNVSGSSNVPAELTAASVQTLLGLNALAYLSDIVTIDTTTTDTTASNVNVDIPVVGLTIGRLYYYEGTFVQNTSNTAIRVVSIGSSRYIVLWVGLVNGTGTINSVTAPFLKIGAATTNMYSISSIGGQTGAVGLLLMRLS